MSADEEVRLRHVASSSFGSIMPNDTWPDWEQVLYDLEELSLAEYKNLDLRVVYPLRWKFGPSRLPALG
jgi:hypothetical protein